MFSMKHFYRVTKRLKCLHISPPPPSRLPENGALRVETVMAFEADACGCYGTNTILHLRIMAHEVFAQKFCARFLL